MKEYNIAHDAVNCPPWQLTEENQEKTDKWIEDQYKINDYRREVELVEYKHNILRKILRDYEKNKNSEDPQKTVSDI